MPFYTNGYGIMAVFWADVNTNDGGDIWARQTTDFSILHRVSATGTDVL